MQSDDIILRHVTPIENIPSILKEGKLSAQFSLRRLSYDRIFVCFEVYTGSRFLEEQCKKKSREGGVFSLMFSKKDMLENAIIFQCGNGLPGKVENIVFVYDGSITKSEYEQIGEYLFVKHEVPLKYLTNDCKRKLSAYARENNIFLDENVLL